MSTPNPYAPPKAQLDRRPDQEPQPSERFIPGGRTRPAGQGWQWIAQAWQIFKRQPLNWLGALVLSFGLLMLLSMVPLLNLVTSLLFPILAAGLGVCARNSIVHGRFDLDQILAGFRTRPGSLVVLGLLYIALTIVLLSVVTAIFGASGLLQMFTGSISDRQAAMAQFFATGGSWVVLGYALVMLVAVSSICFAPFLIQEQAVSAPQAMVMSFQACLKNILASTVWGLSYFALAILACIPFFLGWFVLVPVMMLSQYCAYRDIFVDTDSALGGH